MGLTPMIAWHEGRLARRELAIMPLCPPVCDPVCPPVCKILVYQNICGHKKPLRRGAWIITQP